MNIYTIEINIGTKFDPDFKVERMMAGNWQECCEILAKVFRDFGCEIYSVSIEKVH